MSPRNVHPSDTARTDGGVPKQRVESAGSEQTRTFEHVGHPVKRVEDNRLLTGCGNFIDDLDPVKNLHHLAILRSPHAHARIERIETADAMSMPGVKAVITGEDVSQLTRPFPVTAENPPRDYYALAVDKVRYAGEPVAAVVADDKYRARDAVERIDVTYERLEALVDPEEVLERDGAHIHDAGDVATHRTFEFGDVDGEFERADRTVSKTVRVPHTACPPLETYGVVTAYDAADDSLDVWVNFQGPMSMYTVFEHVLPLPDNRIRLRTPEDQGGGFGVKISIYPYMVLATVASMVADVPVKWIESRREHLLASSMHAGRVQTVEGAVDDDGTVRAIRFRLVSDYGAYIRPPEPGNAYVSFGHWQGPYDLNALEADLYDVQTNTSPTGPHRGYGQQFHTLAMEGLMDEIAVDLDVDPVDIRLKNFIEADQFPFTSLTGGEYDSGQYAKALTKGIDAFDYDDWRDRASEEAYVGVGISAIVDAHASNMGYMDVAVPEDERSYRKSGAVETAIMMMGPDATVRVTLTSTPEGQGHETSALQIVAEELGLPYSDIYIEAGIDTGTQPWAVSSGAYSDRFATMGHTAISQASRELRDQIEAVGAFLLETTSEHVRLADGEVVAEGGESVSLERIANTVYWNPAELDDDIDAALATFTVVNQKEAAPVSGNQVNSVVSNGFAAHLAAVAVDPETGEVEVLDYLTVHDAGRLLNPMIVRGQVSGATAYGIWVALREAHEYSPDGNLQTDTLMDYKMSTAKEAVDITQEFVESPSPHSEYGSKGIGDAGTIAAVPAVTNAVRDALRSVDAPVDSIPLSPDRVWQQLHGGD